MGVTHIKRKIHFNRSRHNKESLSCKRYTVEEWIKEWYKTYKEPKHASTTRQVQWTYIDHHIIPHLGHLSINKVQTTDIQQFLNHLSTKGNCSKLKHNNKVGKPLAAWTIKKIRALLLASFDAAIREDIIQRNPVRDTEPIPIKTLQVACFTPDQQAKFLEGTKKHRFHTAYQLLFYTGCRRSEILGLSWDCIDLDQSQIHIRQVLVNIDGKPLLKDYPKTRSSVRTIPLHPKLTKILREHLKKQEAEKKENPLWDNSYNLVFTNKDGSPHSPSYFLHNFKNAIKKLNLPRNLRVHSTRHTFATTLLQLGIPLSDVQHLGGWADTRVVLEIYSHAVQASHRTAVKKLFENK